jgi:dTDP-L-rhamnose 4-epimerase
MSGERVLVTGGAGFIGAHTSVDLLKRGYQVRVLDWLEAPVHVPGSVPPWIPDDVELMQGDIKDRSAVERALDGIDAVIHLAAYQDYLPDFSNFFHTNTVGTALLYEIIVAKRLPIRKVVVASSQASYGEGRHMCAEHGVVFPGLRSSEQLEHGKWEIPCPVCQLPTQWQPTDESRVNPQNQYALSKYTQEMVAFNLGRRYGIPTTCMRYSITQGRWQSPRNAYSGICRIFAVRALAGKAPIVFEDGHQMRDYVYVEDVARANVLAMEDSRTDFNAYNVGGAVATSALQYAETVIRVIGVKAEPQIPGYFRFGDTRHMVSDISALRALGWEPTLSVEKIVEQYANWAAESGFPDVTDSSIARMLELGTLRRVG